MHRRVIIPAFVLICLISTLLIGVTFGKWFESYRSLAGFSIKLIAVCDTFEPDEFEMHLLVTNDGDIDARVKRLSLLLDWENRLIASDVLHPDALTTASGESVEFTTVLTSSLPETRRPSLEECATDGPWSVRMEIVLEHPTREGEFILRRESTLGQ